MVSTNLPVFGGPLKDEKYVTLQCLIDRNIMNIIIPDSIKQHIENLDTGIKYLNKFAKSYGPITRVLKFNVTVLDEEIYLELQATDGGFPKSEYYILGMRFIGYNMARTTFPRILYPRQDLGIPKFSVGDLENCKISIYIHNYSDYQQYLQIAVY